MKTTKEAIESRRSIRKFKNKAIPEHIIRELIDAARLAPSACNSQSWRFKIISDHETKIKLGKAAFMQKFIVDAPVIIIACADISDYLDGRISGVKNLNDEGIFDEDKTQLLIDKTNNKRQSLIESIGMEASIDVAIALEHIVLRALDFDLGTCWIKLMDNKQINKTFDWDDNIFPVAMLPIGYPNENPKQRKRLTIEDILL